MILGAGTDIIEVERIRKNIANGSRFKEKVFSKNEIDYCEKKSNKAESYAARFAAKEAFFKALGTGWRDGMSFNEVEIMNNELGQPQMNLYGKAKEIAETKNVTNIHVSISHIKEIATSVVILEDRR
jgi:holo-[acyl-carrier protein] synthase